MEKTIDRRKFSQVAAVSVGSILIGCKPKRNYDLQSVVGASASEAPGHAFSSWIRIDTAGKVHLVLDRVEMGQGTMTSHAAMIAEELEISPKDIAVEHAPPGLVYNNHKVLFLQITGGSTSVSESWVPLRKAGAATADLLRRAAAKEWNTLSLRCKIDNGKVVHGNGKQSMGYGQAVERILKDKEFWDGIRDSDKFYGPAADFVLKTLEKNKRLGAWWTAKPRSKNFRVLGKSVPRVDIPDKVSGKAEFGIDIELPGLLNCYVLRNPALKGGTPQLETAIDETFLRRYRLEKVVVIPKKHPVLYRGGVAFVGESFWHCQQAARAVKVRWPKAPLAYTDKSFRGEQNNHLISKNGKAVESSGRENRGGTHVEAIYRLPHAPHQTMEPMTCTVDYPASPRGKTALTIWTGTQLPGGAQELASQITGVAHANIEVKTPFLGGGFGRRITQDYVGEAVWVAKEVRKPVKVIWDREDDTRHGFYRPASIQSMEGRTSRGKMTHWQHKLVGPSVVKALGRDFANSLAPNFVPTKAVQLFGKVFESAFDIAPELDYTTHEGGEKIPYEIDGQFQYRYVYHDPMVPIGFWRSVGNPHTAFAVESFVDELAHADGVDPLKYRRDNIEVGGRILFRNEFGKRLKGCLEQVANDSGYRQKKSGTTGWGVANHGCFGSFCAMIVKINLTGNALRIDKIWAAVDCGMAVNPDIVRSQVESGIVFGLSSALKQEITFRDDRPGVIAQGNFHDCDILRLNECPKINVSIVSSSEKPTGIGEVAVPPVAPALANAIFNVSGKRIREMPFLKTGKLRLV